MVFHRRFSSAVESILNKQEAVAVSSVSGRRNRGGEGGGACLTCDRPLRPGRPKTPNGGWGESNIGNGVIQGWDNHAQDQHYLPIRETTTPKGPEEDDVGEAEKRHLEQKVLSTSGMGSLRGVLTRTDTTFASLSRVPSFSSSSFAPPQPDPDVSNVEGGLITTMTPEIRTLKQGKQSLLQQQQQRPASAGAVRHRSAVKDAALSNSASGNSFVVRGGFKMPKHPNRDQDLLVESLINRFNKEQSIAHVHGMPPHSDFVEAADTTTTNATNNTYSPSITKFNPPPPQDDAIQSRRLVPVTHTPRASGEDR